MIEQYNKITTGWVTQKFERKDKKFVCVEQDFTAGDIVDREDERGEPVDVDVREEVYQSFDMVRPGRGFYFLHVFAGVDASSYGPFGTEQERDKAMENHRENEGREDYDSYFPFDVSKGSTVEF